MRGFRARAILRRRPHRCGWRRWRPVTWSRQAPRQSRSDGSFFVKAPADKPIRFSLLDEKGAVLRQEHGWFWIRRGEQRICVGCHTGPERGSENRVPAVLLRTTTPVDLTGTAKQMRQAASADPRQVLVRRGTPSE